MSGHAESQTDGQPISQKRGGAARRALCSAFGLFGFLAFLIVLAWIVGRAMTDRYPWSQWLWWIPTPAAMAAVVFGMLAALRPAHRSGARRRRLVRWGIGGLAVVIYFTTWEHRLLRPAPGLPADQTAIKISHWNLSVAITSPEILDAVVSKIISLDSDITVLTGPGYAAWEEPVVDALGTGQPPVSFGPLVLLSRLPIKSWRPLVAADRATIALVELDATERIGRPLVLYMVDLPSNPTIPRYALAAKLRRMLDDPTNFGGSLPPPPDIVAGDFNVTRGSASLKALFPNMRHAFDEAGHGYGASFNRQWPLPLYHIDHIMLGESVRALRYDLVDRGLRRHRAQQAWIADLPQ